MQGLQGQKCLSTAYRRGGQLLVIQVQLPSGEPATQPSQQKSNLRPLYVSYKLSEVSIPLVQIALVEELDQVSTQSLTI